MRFDSNKVSSNHLIDTSRVDGKNVLFASANYLPINQKQFRSLTSFTGTLDEKQTQIHQTRLTVKLYNADGIWVFNRVTI